MGVNNSVKVGCDLVLKEVKLFKLEKRSRVLSCRVRKFQPRVNFFLLNCCLKIMVKLLMMLDLN